MLDHLVKKHFGRLHGKKQREVIENLQVVIDQAKPSYLFDACAVPEESLRGFVQDLSGHFPSMKLVKLVNEDFGCDFFIGHQKTMTAAVERALRGETLFIDPNEKTHKLLTDGHLHSLKNTVESLSHEIQASTIIEFSPSGHGTAIYGVLLGFPFVYCQTSNAQGLSNSTLVQVKASRNNVLVSSFTVPKDLIDLNALAGDSLCKWKLSLSSNPLIAIEELTVLPSASMSM